MLYCGIGMVMVEGTSNGLGKGLESIAQKGRSVSRKSSKAREEELIKQVSIFVESYGLLKDIFNNFKLYAKLNEPQYLAKATELTQQFDRLLGKPNGLGVKTMPIGLYESAGSGFHVMPVEVIAAISKLSSSTQMYYGYIKLDPVTAQFSADTFHHLHKQRLSVQQMESTGKTTGNASLDALVRKAYVPLPDEIDSLPLVGPIKLNDKLSSLFLSWVRGPTLHEQMPDLNEMATREGGIYSDFRDSRLWAVSQMTGVWQASPPAIQMKMAPTNPEQHIQNYYVSTLLNSLASYAKFLDGIGLTQKQGEKLDELCKLLIRQLPIDTGNIGRYFDAALRNFIDEVGNVEGTYQNAFNLAVKEGKVDYSAIYDMTRRIDFSHVAERPFCVFEEDISHITENWRANITGEERRRYQSEITLTRQTLNAYNSGNTRTAMEMAEELEALRIRAAKPGEIKSLRSYDQRYGKTIEVMPLIRKIRQGSLALVYASKALAVQERSGEDLSGVISCLVEDETNAYLLRSSQELPMLSSALRIEKGSAAYEGIRILTDLLTAAEEQAKKGNINAGNMVKEGNLILARYESV